MDPGTVIVLGIVVAGLGLLWWVGFVLLGSPPPEPAAPPAMPTFTTDARLMCPRDGAFSHVRIGVRPSERRLAIIGCDRYGSDEPECDRACLQLTEITAPSAN